MCSLELYELLQLNDVISINLKMVPVVDPLVLQDNWIITIAPPVCV